MPRSVANWPSTSPQAASRRSCSARGSITNEPPRTGSTAVSVWRSRSRTAPRPPCGRRGISTTSRPARHGGSGGGRSVSLGHNGNGAAQRRPRPHACKSQVVPRGSHSQTGWPPARAKLATPAAITGTTAAGNGNPALTAMTAVVRPPASRTHCTTPSPRNTPDVSSGSSR